MAMRAKQVLAGRSGAELIQFAIVVALVSLLAVAVGAVFLAAQGQIEGAADAVENIAIGGP